MDKKAQLIVIFGGTGDLTFRKLLPALYNMDQSNTLPKGSKVLIVGRRDYSSEIFREKTRGWVERFSRVAFSDDRYDVFSQIIHYFKMDFTNEDEYEGLASYLKTESGKELIFYFAVAPHFFSNIAEGLSTIPEASQGKLVLEKPFGVDLAEARADRKSTRLNSSHAQ